MREALMQWSSGARGRRHPRLGGAAAWLVAALMGMPSSGLAAVPEVGQDITGALEVRIGKRIPLPQGRWKVETVFQEPQQLIMPDGQPYTRPRHIVVLSHEDARAEVPLIVLDFTDAERLNWTGQPCDTPTRNPALLSNTLGTTASSLSVRCNRVFAYDNFRATIARGNISANAWMAKRFGTLSSRAPGLPVHGLFAEGSMSAHLGDRLFVLAYANPGVHGLDGAADQPNPFRAPAGGHAAALQSYMSAFATWFDAYTDQIAGSYLQGGLSAPTVAVFRFNAPTSPAQAAMSTAATAVAPAAHARAQAPAQAAAPPATPRATVAAVPAAPVVPAKPATSAASALSVHALVVGNAAYPGARLVNSGNDANAVAARLRSYGFDVSLVLDAGRRQLVEALAQFAGKARQADVTLFFYAGHGVQLNGVNYLIPVDFDLGAAKAINISFDAVSLNALLEEHLPGKIKLVFLDACRDNPLARSLTASRSGGGRGLAAVNASTGTLISYATRDGSTASDGSGPNSPYTTALLSHLDEEEDISIVLRRVRQRVMDATRGAQEPWEYGSLIGDKLVLSQLRKAR